MSSEQKKCCKLTNDKMYMSIFSICIKPNYQNARSRYKYISDVNITAILDVSEIEV